MTRRNALIGTGAVVTGISALASAGSSLAKGEGKPLRVAVLGTGIMGSGMARSLLGAGLHVTVWNRTASKAQALKAAGAIVAPSIRDAVAEADVVVTMVFDTAAVQEVMEQGVPAMRAGAIWMQCATVGLDGTRSLARFAETRSIAYVDSPVLGSKEAAEGGSLIPVVAGPKSATDALKPIFDAIGSRVMEMGEEVGSAQRLKMVMQSWAMSVTSATGQAFALAANLGVDPRSFLAAIKGGSQDCGYAHIKGEAIMANAFEAQFTVEGAVKDTSLIVEAMHESKTDARMMRALNEGYDEVAAAGRARDDMAAVVFSFQNG
ncbi:NAD(P)-dependent oxidoreductase [Agrobacterium tumefaciens]|uniref:NAD(P)-dependent oxidoreductase n=1 Tax=Agrobacterium tumefaciens TaxID=358 RepID=A0AA44JAD2_AGRTU|nr:NAD(P)-dependent oxidoreductase [Agrobacterium tumefaciens]NTB87633.1 NAD(P)-dependent oxidoreductase [Agrobacterium tumefaciens]NTC19999.1 NAD(P)-dependent oxidoreductase [Agrobacterium tumefaciens]NTC29818.1 NAD(P)-dependent oxidoreductase [Agrobacterium tumefaciens]